MQKAVEITYNHQVLRGMEHIPAGEKVPAVILLHGFTGTKLEPHRFFLKISRALEALGIASFRFDFLGSGESDGNFEDMTVLKELDEAKAIFEFVKSHPSVDSNQIAVLGFSMGGLVASLFAGDFPDDVHKLILLAPAGEMRKMAKAIGETAMFIESLNGYDLGGNLIGKPFIEELQTLEVWTRASQYEKNVLIVHGTEDQAVPFNVSSSYIENCYHEKATLIQVDNADHTFNSVDWEEKVIRSICEFLE
ncbi:MAG: alpha/beta fold hydrolase [Bacillota bacterium]|nr:alpha/beta fold hydrolase [Bacillota bacterium]MDP4170443.1 alpha/beta fold hydrolase [Bacillota bacterium]